MRDQIAHPPCSVVGKASDILTDTHIGVLAAKALGFDAGGTQLDHIVNAFHDYFLVDHRDIAATRNVLGLHEYIKCILVL